MTKTAKLKAIAEQLREERFKRMGTLQMSDMAARSARALLARAIELDPKRDEVSLEINAAYRGLNTLISFLGTEAAELHEQLRAIKEAASSENALETKH